MQELRCVCKRKLGESDGRGRVEIKCPKCGRVMKFGPQPPYPAQRPHHGLVHRQTPPQS